MMAAAGPARSWTWQTPPMHFATIRRNVAARSRARLYRRALGGRATRALACDARQASGGERALREGSAADPRRARSCGDHRSRAIPHRPAESCHSSVEPLLGGTPTRSPIATQQLRRSNACRSACVRCSSKAGKIPIVRRLGRTTLMRQKGRRRSVLLPMPLGHFETRCRCRRKPRSRSVAPAARTTR